MKNYLLRITPLEPFTFGGENGFSFEEIGYKGTYYMKSGMAPEQTTIIGMIRYLLLKSEGKLNPSFSYSEEEKKDIATICGPATFSFEPEGPQSFGYIKSISPLFIIDEDNDIYIKNPFCNKAKKLESSDNSYKALKLMNLSTQIDCSMGEGFSFPSDKEEDGYNAKDGYGSGYICINANKSENQRLKESSDFFKSSNLVGNRKNTQKEDDNFFKREVITMKNASFGVYMTLDDNAAELVSGTIVYMGKKKSAFRVDAERVSETITLKEQAEAFFASYGFSEKWYYCLSDVLPQGRIEYKNFGITESKLIRNLKTDYSNKGMHRKGQKRYSLIVAGSVFYGEIPKALQIDNYELKKVGYNQIIKLGGK